MAFKIIEVIDGGTFRVFPNWGWSDHEGDKIKLNGYVSLPPEHDREAKKILKNLLLNREVELKNPVRVSEGRLICDIYIDNKSLVPHILNIRQAMKIPLGYVDYSFFPKV